MNMGNVIFAGLYNYANKPGVKSVLTGGIFYERCIVAIRVDIYMIGVSQHVGW